MKCTCKEVELTGAASLSFGDGWIHSAMSPCFKAQPPSPTPDNERIYPCSKCGKLRTKAEGGTIFAACDDCWDDKFKSQTPETDAISFVIASGDWIKETDCTDCALNHARKLERERDEANARASSAISTLAIEAISRRKAESDLTLTRKVADSFPSTIHGKSLRRYMFEQFPACDGHIPFMEFCGKLEQALADYNQLKQ